MMDAREAASKWGVSVSAVRKACRARIVPGARIEKNRVKGKGVWMIPRDAKSPGFRCIRQNRLNIVAVGSSKFEARQKAKEYGLSDSEFENALHIWNSQCMVTIGQLAQDLGIESLRVVELYELGFQLFQ